MGSGIAELQKEYNDYTKTLLNEGILNDQFLQLQLLQDESNPEFVVEVINLYFDDSQRLLDELAISLQQENVDFKKIDAQVHQLKGSSSSIGAQKVQNACIGFRSYCNEKNIEGSLKSLQQVRNEYIQVKSKLETLLKLGQQIVAAGGSIPNTVTDD